MSYYDMSLEPEVEAGPDRAVEQFRRVVVSRESKETKETKGFESWNIEKILQIAMGSKSRKGPQGSVARG